MTNQAGSPDPALPRHKRFRFGISTILGIAGVISSFGLFYIAEEVLHIDRDHAQTLMYLKLSVAGHLMIFVTRTRGPFWTIRPAPILLIAVFGTQILATLVAVYGFVMAPIGWRLALLVWAYAVLWFFVTDGVKLAAHRMIDPDSSPMLLRRRARSVPHTHRGIDL